MRKILKFPIRGLGPDEIKTTNYLVPLSVGWQDGLVLWAECTPVNSVFAYQFSVFGTGREIPDDYTGAFIGTVQGSDGYVYHVHKD